jgi:cytochrome b561
VANSGDIYMWVMGVPLMMVTLSRCTFARKKEKKENSYKEGRMKDIGARVGFTILYLIDL